LIFFDKLEVLDFHRGCTIFLLHCVVGSLLQQSLGCLMWVDVWTSGGLSTQNTQRHKGFIPVQASEPYVQQLVFFVLGMLKREFLQCRNQERERERGVRGSVVGFGRLALQSPNSDRSIDRSFSTGAHASPYI